MKPHPGLPRTGSHLGLRLWESSSGAGHLSYSDTRGYRVVAGEPHFVRTPAAESPASYRSELFQEFERDCFAAGRRPVYFGLPASSLNALDPDGKRGRWHAGDLPVFSLDRWCDLDSFPAAIRSQARRAHNQGVRVRRLASPPGPADPAGPALRACLQSWLESKSLPPMGFVTSPFLFDPWPEQGVFIAERCGVVEGFLTASIDLFPDLWRVDAVGRAPNAPNGCAELLISEAFCYAAEQCYERATLGLAPLSRRSTESVSPMALRVARTNTHWMNHFAEIVREVGLPGYSFAGLEAFKAKFKPEDWRPLYCVSGGGRLTFRDMLAITRVFAGKSLLAYGFSSLLWQFGRRNLPAQGESLSS